MGARTSNETIVNQNNLRIAAMQKYVTNGKTEIPIGGAMLKPADVIAIFQNDVDNRQEVMAAKAAYGAAVAKRSTLDATRQSTDDALKGWVLNRFGATSTEAKEFGYAPRKRPTVSAETRANAVKLNKATREARGTVSKKKKLAIKGTLDGASPPVASPSSPTPEAPPPATAAAAAPAVAAAAPNGAVHS